MCAKSECNAAGGSSQFWSHCEQMEEGCLSDGLWWSRNVRARPNVVPLRAGSQPSDPLWRIRVSLSAFADNNKTLRLMMSSD